ncbi:MAG TPA: NAD(P)/FAD-dependent oxidoreductase [Polyangia bacterium]|nr:NAD(P)/FAD-dependent oxidoreductase [Polyangia bacterium]
MTTPARPGVDADVIVIGAGAAGLEAALRLAQSRFQVIVLEARPRVGGRIDTHLLPGWPAPVEGGAEFVHGRPAPLIARLAAARAKIVAVPPRRLLIVEGGVVHPAGARWRRAQAAMDELPDEDVSFAALFKRPDFARRFAPDVRRLLLGFVEGFNAADARRVSVRSLNRQTETSEADRGDLAFRVRDGYDALPRFLGCAVEAHGGEVRLGTVVREIRWGRRGVAVVADGAWGGPLPEVRARAALVTVPLGVLQAPPSTRGALRFIPGLPAQKRRAIARLAMGNVVKIAVRFRDPLGKGVFASVGPDANFLHLPGAPIPTWWGFGSRPPRCLVGWVAGPRADRFAAAHAGARPPAERVDAALGALARALKLRPLALRAAVEDARVFDWAEDPFARGAYSWIPVGGLDAPRALGAPLDGRLFFAGEATDRTGEPGTVHAALASGARAAGEIADSLGRPRR